VPAYFFAQVQITDPEGFDEYSRAFSPTLKPFGGRVLAADDGPTQLEGEWPAGRTVLLEFESTEQAQAWYDSDAYQAISHIRRANSTSTIAIVKGYDRASRD
jgi:uncharacterized protein (DUF1330 family)